MKGSFNKYFSETRARNFGEEARRRIILGTFARMAGYKGKYYHRAFQARSLVIRDFEKIFRGSKAVDVLIAPTMPIVAPRFKEIERLTPAQHYQMDVLTVVPNLAGIPHMTVPWGEVERMPVGIHVLGDHLQEGKVFRAGKALEEGMKPREMG